MSADPRIPRVGLGLLTRYVPPQMVERVLAETGRRQQRTRRLTAAFMVYFVLACTLMPGSGYAGVLAHLVAGLRRLATGWPPPTTSSLTKARRRLTAQALTALFEKVRGPIAGPGIGQAWRFGLRLIVTDGTTIDLPDTPANQERYGRPKRGGFPQARLTAVLECGTRAVIAAAWDSYRTSELKLFERILPTLDGAGTLLLADKNFLSHRRWQAATATGAHLLWRVRNGFTFPLPKIRKLPDGSYLSRLFDPADAQRHRKAADRGHPRPGLPGGITVRVIPYTVTTIRADGQKTTSYYRLITSLLDHHTAPASELAACYRERWQEETGLADLKTRQQQPGGVLRSHTPGGVEQEIAAHLIVYQALRRLALHAADHAGVDCQRVSFTAVREVACRQLGTNAAPTSRTLRTHLHDASQEITSRLLPKQRRERSYRRQVKHRGSRYPAHRHDPKRPASSKVSRHVQVGTQAHPTPVPDP